MVDQHPLFYLGQQSYALAIDSRSCFFEQVLKVASFFPSLEDRYAEVDDRHEFVFEACLFPYCFNSFFRRLAIEQEVAFVGIDFMTWFFAIIIQNSQNAFDESGYSVEEEQHVMCVQKVGDWVTTGSIIESHLTAVKVSRDVSVNKLCKNDEKESKQRVPLPNSSRREKEA